MDTSKFIELGKQMGLDGQDLHTFVSEREKAREEIEKLKIQAQKAKEETEQLKIQVEKAKEETEQLKIQAEKETAVEIAKLKTHAETEKAERKARAQFEQEKLKEEYEIAMEKIKQDKAKELPQNTAYLNGYTPEIPVFNDETDNMDAYLKRFARLAMIYKWSKADWATMLSALLSGSALEVYARLSNDDSIDYDKLKTALLKRYNLTEQGFHLKFRESKPQGNENPVQFATRIGHYLGGWLEMAEAMDYDSLKAILIKEQFLKACPRNVAVHLIENTFQNMTEMCNQAARYLQAHNQDFASDNQRYSEGNNTAETESTTDKRQRRECFNCGKTGHIRAVCRNQGGGDEQYCTKCKRFGHKMDNCKSTAEFGGMIRMKRGIKQKSQRRQIASSYTNVQHSNKQVPEETETKLM